MHDLNSLLVFNVECTISIRTRDKIRNLTDVGNKEMVELGHNLYLNCVPARDIHSMLYDLFRH